MADQIPLILIDAGAEDNVSFFPSAALEEKKDFQPPTDDPIPDKADREKANLTALSVLNDLEKNPRVPTAKDQAKLARFTGWVGLKRDDFALKKALPEKQYEDLKLCPDVPLSTPSGVVNTVYKVLYSMGFETGSILVFGDGTGSFIGRMPVIMRKNSRVAAGTTDPITTKLVKNLYPNVDVLEDNQVWAESLYDIAIGMVPFADQKRELDYRGRNKAMDIYEYVMTKSLLALRSGGIFAAIVPREYNDNPTRYRSPAYMALNSHLEHLLSLRLDDSAFPEDHGTYDILFYRKRPGSENNHRINWGKTIETEYPEHLRPNKRGRYTVATEFVRHPEYIMGKPFVKYIPQQGNKLIIEPFIDTRRALVDAIEKANIKRTYQPVAIDKKSESAVLIHAQPKYKNYSMVIIGGIIYQRVDSVMVQQNLSPIKLFFPSDGANGRSRNVNGRAYRASQLRYRRAALEIVQRDRFYDELYDIASECSDLEWAVGDDETLLDVFDGDTDEMHEFQLMFAELTGKCESLLWQLRDNYVTEYFDDFFVGALGSAYRMVGYDSFEEDYFNLTKYEAELAQTVSGKRISRLSKEKIIAVAGQCLGVMMCFLDIRHSYSCLKAIFELLRDERAELLKSIRAVEEAYQKTQDDPYDWNAQSAYDNLLSRFPDRVWTD